MREIILQPGATIEIDGVRIRAAKPQAAAAFEKMMYDPASCQLAPLGPEQTKCAPVPVVIVESRRP